MNCAQSLVDVHVARLEGHFRRSTELCEMISMVLERNPVSLRALTSGWLRYVSIHPISL